jgi:hypothetical protein
MTYYVSYHIEEGNCFGYSTFFVDHLPDGYICEEREGDIGGICNCEWNRNTRQFESKTSSVISKLDFQIRFTTEERIAARVLAETDLVVADFFRLLEIAEEIDLTNELVYQGLLYLVSKGIIDAERISAILKV